MFELKRLGFELEKTYLISASNVKQINISGNLHIVEIIFRFLNIIIQFLTAI